MGGMCPHVGWLPGAQAVGSSLAPRLPALSGRSGSTRGFGEPSVSKPAVGRGCCEGLMPWPPFAGRKPAAYHPQLSKETEQKLSAAERPGPQGSAPRHQTGEAVGRAKPVRAPSVKALIPGARPSPAFPALRAGPRAAGPGEDGRPWSQSTPPYWPCPAQPHRESPARGPGAVEQSQGAPQPAAPPALE